MEPDNDMWCYVTVPNGNGKSKIDEFFHIHFQISESFQQQEHNSVVLFATIFYASYVCGALFLICDLALRFTNAFEEIYDEIVAFQWKLFPLAIQKLLPIILIETQQPAALYCFGKI